MSNDNLTYQDLLQIVELVKASSQFSEFRLKVGDIEIEMKRHRAGAARPPATVPGLHASPGVGPSGQPAGHASGADLVGEPAGPALAGDAPHHAAPLGYTEQSVLIKSPMVGTFYRAPAPGAPPFVAIGQSVDEDTTVCIIEVMKLMNSIPAGTRGVVTHILVEDGEPVEFGQVLLVIEPR